MSQHDQPEPTDTTLFAALVAAGLERNAEMRTYGASKTSDAELVFVERMKRERNRRRWSQKALAAVVEAYGVEMHPTAVTKLERVDRDDRRNLRLNEALAIAAAFGLTVDRMLTDDDLGTQRAVDEAQRRVEELEVRRFAAEQETRKVVDELHAAREDWQALRELLAAEQEGGDGGEHQEEA